MAGYREGSPTEPGRPRRSPGEGSIYPYRGRHRGALSWTDRDGNRHRRTVYGKTKRDVRLELDKLREELARGLPPAKPRTVADYLTGWLENVRQTIRPSTWRQYEANIRVHIVPAVGRLELAELTPSDVERMTAAMVKAGNAPRSAQLVRTILRRALADAQRDGLVHRNVAALARAPHVPARALRAGVDYLTPDDLRRLVTAAKVHPFGPLVTLAGATGLRLGELLGLSWADIDSEAGTLTVRRALARSWDGWALAAPKTDKSRRTLNLPAAGRVALERQRELQDAARLAAGDAWQDHDGLVFTDAVGQPLRGYVVNKAFHRLLDAAGLPSVPFHGLRHSAATAMLAAGVSMRTVSDALGHSTITVTADRYAGVTPDQKREAADAMDRALGAEA